MQVKVISGGSFTSDTGLGIDLTLSPHRYPDESKPLIQQDDWLATVQLILSRYKINRLSMPVNTVANVVTGIDKFLTGAISRKDAVKAIDSLLLSAHEFMIVETLCSLIHKLPPLPIKENVNKSALCSNFVYPFHSGVLGDTDAGAYLHWTNGMTLEAKKHGDRESLCP